MTDNERRLAWNAYMRAYRKAHADEIRAKQRIYQKRHRAKMNGKPMEDDWKEACVKRGDWELQAVQYETDWGDVRCGYYLLNKGECVMHSQGPKTSSKPTQKTLEQFVSTFMLMRKRERDLK